MTIFSSGLCNPVENKRQLNNFRIRGNKLIFVNMYQLPDSLGALYMLAFSGKMMITSFNR